MSDFTKDDIVLIQQARNILIQLYPDRIKKSTPRTKVIKAVQDILGEGVSGSKMCIVKMFCQQYRIAAPASRSIFTGRNYVPDRAMRMSIARLTNTPSQITLLSRKEGLAYGDQ